MQMVLEPWSTPFSPTAVDQTHTEHMTSASHSAYVPRPYRTQWDSHAEIDPPSRLWPNSSDSLRHLELPLIEQEIHDSGHHHFYEPNAYRSLSSSSHATCSHFPSAPDEQNVTNPFIPHHLPSHQSLSPFSPHWCPQTTSTGYLEPGSRFRHIPPQDSTISSRRRRCIRAVEYSGLWIDEEELLKGLMKPDGKLNVHQCRWEEGHSPCHLWIKGDKSSINAHIQKWHNGKSGGDKVEVGCLWSACGRTMLKVSIARHIVSIQLGEMWECLGCGKEITRNDTFGKHAVTSDFEPCRNAGALITYAADVRMIDVRAALDNGGRVRYADE